MPRLHGYRERIPLNMYDAVALREIDRKDPRVRLFGNQNIGDPVRTNLQIAGQLASDQTAIIMNWYARTNIEFANETQLDAWAAWVNAATVTVILGVAPIHQLPLRDLLLRREGQMRPDIEREHAGAHESPVVHEGTIDAMAAQLYATVPIAEGEQFRKYRDAYHVAPSSVRERWRDVARAALDFLKVPLLMVIPCRQNFGVRIDADKSAHGALLEVLPTSVAPQGLVWVHLEGVMTRDVA